MRVGKFLLNLAIFAALAIGPYYAFQLYWKWAGTETVYRIGYLLWQASSLDETNNRMRVNDIQQVVTSATQILLSIVGGGWGLLRMFGGTRAPKA
jgi:hypothetical protein